MQEFVYFELNDWEEDTYYPDTEFFESLLFKTDENGHLSEGLLWNKKWVEDNKIIVVSQLVDMSVSYCISATKEWIDENCPELLTKYTKFLRKSEIGQFGCPFIDYTEDRIGMWIYDNNAISRYQY